MITYLCGDPIPEENDMTNEEKDKELMPVPANEGIDIPAKAQPPDENHTRPGSLPGALEEADGPFEAATFSHEHRISRDHAEPIDVTETTNDNAIEGELIDVGGGD